MSRIKTMMLVVAGLVAITDVALACGSNTARGSSTRASSTRPATTGSVNAGTPR